MIQTKDAFYLWYIEKQSTEIGLLNLTDVALYLGVNYNTVTYASYTKKITSYNWEKTIYYSLQDVNNHLNKSKNITATTQYKVWYNELIYKEKGLLRMTTAAYYCNCSTTAILNAFKKGKIEQFRWHKCVYYSQKSLDNYLMNSKRL